MDSKQDDEKLRLADRENSANKKFQIPKINTQLLPSKAYYFFYHGTHGCLFAYLSVFYKQMGMNAIRVGILSALKPFINSVFAPIGGALADKFRKRKLILLLSMAIWAVGMLCIGLLPTPTALHICPLELQPQQNFSTSIPEVTDAIKTKYVSDIGWLYDADWISNTFLVIAMCLIVAEAFYGPSSPLGDTAVITSLGEANRHEYARQRSWGGLGAGLFQLATAGLLQTTTTHQTICGIELAFTDYRIAFYACLVTNTIAIIIASTFTFTYVTEEHSLRKCKAEDGSDIVMSQTPELKKADDTTQFDLRKLAALFCSVHYMSWLLCTCYFGISSGILNGFLTWYIELLGGSALLMGFVGVIDYGTEFIFYNVAPYIIRRIGSINTLYVALVTYTIRFAVYAAVTNPWVFLPVEVLQGFASATVWAALVSHASQAVPSGCLASVMSLIYGAYWGLGMAAGSLLGGVLIELFGAQSMFLILVATTLAVLLIFIVAQKLSVVPAYEREVR